jgi:FlaA1/EpsC-like NDP-sugar epimerase
MARSKYAVALANGTLALDVALKALNIAPGDEVVVTPRTFIASVSCVVNAGAKPVFADVDADSGNITAQSIEAVLTPATRAIICVHLAGWPCDMDPIMALAETHGLKVIEDCAQAHGARYKGRSVGSIGHVGAWSFCQDKIMTTGGEGGMVSAGRQLANAMTSSTDTRVVGFLDDDDRLHGHVLNGLPIFNPSDLPELVTHRNITDILMALPSISRQRRNAILADIAPLHVAVRTLPGMMDLASGKVSISDVQDLDIDDLLGREAIKPNGLLLNRNTHQRTVLVTGAGGSIGSELCRQILATNPKQLLLVEMSEFALYQIHQELQELATTVELVPLLASVCDEVRMHEIMDTWKPHTVYHAAAYKHVPLVEHNPAEGVRNNVWGTLTCAQAAARHGVQNFVLVSTDKAVRPTNIMGATKRLAEMVLQALAELNPAVLSEGGRAPAARTCFSMVRFGNVLGSSGSVVPLFRQQIKNGGPITLTHADITRYFMTIPEAAQLVIQAGAMGMGGDVFVLDMGQPVRIYDLARRMVELSGLSVCTEDNPEGDIEIAITGLRPGEKLYEELLIGNNPQRTQHARIMQAHEEFLPWPLLEAKLQALNMAVGVNDVPMIRGFLQQLVQGYTPAGEVVDWVHLAHEREARASGLE